MSKVLQNKYRYSNDKFFLISSWFWFITPCFHKGFLFSCYFITNYVKQLVTVLSAAGINDVLNFPFAPNFYQLKRVDTTM